MRRQQPKDSSFEDIDEHELPTDPMIPVVLSPFAPTQINDATQPTQSAQPSVYPYLPPAPVKKNKHNGYRPAGGAAPSSPSPIASAYPASTAYPVLSPRRTNQAQSRQSPIPPLIGVFFVAVQLLLLVRFMLKLLNFSGNARWLLLIYQISDIFVFPFRLLLQNTGLAFLSVEIYTLLAILVYGLFSRILVRFLKALLNSR